MSSVAPTIQSIGPTPGGRWNALKVAAIGAEAAVISTLSIASFHVAFPSIGPDWLAAAPLATVIALESTRLPLAFHLGSGRAGFLATMCGAVMLAGLSVITGEAASIAFSNLIDQRIRPVSEAESALARAQIDHDAQAQAGTRRAAEIARLKSDLEAAGRRRTDIDRPLTLQTIPDSKACAGRHGSSWNCSGAAQTAAIKANSAAMAAHVEELKNASAQVAAAQGRLNAVEAAPDMQAVDQAVAEAQRQLADARATSPMWKAAAAWMQTSPEDLSSQAFSVVKRWAVILLSIATAVTTATAAIIAALPDRAERKPSKLVQALRSLMLARRRRHPIVIRRDVPGPIQYRDRPRFVYVATDDAGRVRNPDDLRTP